MAEKLSGDYACWNCGQSIAGVFLPLSRTECCPACNADLYVCKMCVHYRPGGSHPCNEERAEPPSDPARANFCDYLTLRTAEDLLVGGHSETAQTREAKAQLAALFGESVPTPEDGNELSASDKARNELDALFGLGTNDDA